MRSHNIPQSTQSLQLRSHSALRQFHSRCRAACIARVCVVSSLASATHPQPSSIPADACPSLRVSQRIAAARAAESRRQRNTKSSDIDAPLFIDPYAELLANWPACHHQQHHKNEKEEAHDIIATAHIDRLLLQATSVSAVNRITQGDYRQVVLVGDALDTRPFRLPWPPGTALFLVAPAAAHAVAEAVLASAEAAAIAAATAAEATAPPPSPPAEAAAAAEAQRGRRGRRPPAGPRPPPGCLVRRVHWDFAPDPTAVHYNSDLGGGGSSNADDAAASGPDHHCDCNGNANGDGTAAAGSNPTSSSSSSSLSSALAAAGFRADRLSVWGFQGLAGRGLGRQGVRQAVRQLLAEAGLCAAFHSLMLGELPAAAVEGEEGEGEEAGEEEAAAAAAAGYWQVANALAEAGLLGAPLAFGTPDSSYGRWRDEWSSPGRPTDADQEEKETEQPPQPQPHPQQHPCYHSGRGHPREQRWLFAAQQLRLSGAQMDTYRTHSEAAEAADEDFFGNFS